MKIITVTGRDAADTKYLCSAIIAKLKNGETGTFELHVDQNDKWWGTVEITNKSEEEKMQCNICKKELNNPSDATSADQGGDCIQCMAWAGDPECIYIMEELQQAELMERSDPLYVEGLIGDGDYFYFPLDGMGPPRYYNNAGVMQ